MTVEATARQAQAALEPFVAMIYFVPEGPTNYEQVGLKPRQAYFCTRSAAMGAVPGELVASTFYNFNPEMVVPQVNDGWSKTTPVAAAEARNKAVIEALTRLLPEEDGSLPDLSKAVAQVKKACQNLKIEGRPLFAAHYAHSWPDENPLLSLWWGANLLREYRGDGHIGALLAHEISGIEAILIMGAWSSRVPFEMLLKTRAWSEAQVDAAYQGLQERGLMQDRTLTEKGRAVREGIEDMTDRLAVSPWQNLSDEADEFINTMKQLSRRLVERGAMGARR